MARVLNVVFFLLLVAATTMVNSVPEMPADDQKTVGWIAFCLDLYHKCLINPIFCPEYYSVCVLQHHTPSVPVSAAAPPHA
ncbi:hypothetical protein A2U01_0058325 [Trifolium medium]|uniref:Uncharacterized protein n=1 Tax=Trifolium medium TaxID=97028 RepID=A0A392RKG4_9FABA|nr:hypothetical protein [Trifolium medium]